MPDRKKPLAYNSLWQFRNDTWSSLEEVEHSAAPGRGPVSARPARLAETVTGLLDGLGPIERFWAFPGAQTFQEVQRLFAAGKYDRFAAMVSGINRALVTESYRDSQAWTRAIEDDATSTRPRPAEQARPHPPVLRGSGRRGPDRGAGALAAGGAAALAPPG